MLVSEDCHGLISEHYNKSDTQNGVQSIVKLVFYGPSFSIESTACEEDDNEGIEQTCYCRGDFEAEGVWDLIITTVYPEGKFWILIHLYTPFRAFKEGLDTNEDEQEEKSGPHQDIFVELEYFL